MTVDTVPTGSVLTAGDAGLSAPIEERDQVAGLVPASYGPQKGAEKSSTKTVRQTGWGRSYR